MNAYRFECPTCGDTWSVLERDLVGEPRETCGACGDALDVQQVEVEPYGE